MPDPIKKKIKDNPSGETKWTTKGGTYIPTGEANIWFQLTEFAPSCLFKHKFKVDRNAKSASYDIILGCNAIKKLQFDLLYSENIPKIPFKQEVEIDCKPCGFWSCSRLHQVSFQAQQSTIDKAEEEFLEKQCFSQAQYQAADLCNAYLIICHCKKRRNSMPCLTNTGSFSMAPLDSFPPSLFTSKSNGTPSLSMDAHSLFQKPMKV
jgi:hypothetical protein